MGRLTFFLPLGALLLSTSLAISYTQSVSNNNARKPERWSRQIDPSGFPQPTVNARHNGEDWIPINPNSPVDRSNNGRVLNFGPQQQQPLFAAQNQQIFQHPPQFLAQTQFIPPTFPGNDLNNGPIPQQPINQFPSLFGDHRFGSLSHVPQQQQLQQSPKPPNSPMNLKISNTPFQFDFTAAGHKSPLFQQLSPQFVNEHFFEIPDKINSQKKFPNAEPLNQKPKRPFQSQGPELLHHPPPPPPPPPSAPGSGPGQSLPPRHHPEQQSQQQPEEVQLLYVPLDTYYQQQQQQQQHQQQSHIPQHNLQQNSVFNPLPQFINPTHINDFYTPQPVRPLTIQTTTPLPRNLTPATAHKPKAHQPPLAMFMLQGNKFSRGITVNDILETLRRERSIAVLDTITAEAQPNIFIGPAGLKTPNGYEKFELPYLSAIESTRIDRKLDGFPFFVAPLSYQTPNGFTKIPLPHPHVGSVVINDQKMVNDFGQPSTTTSRPDVPLFTRNYNSNFISATPLPQKFDPLTRKYVAQTTTEGYQQFAEDQQFIKDKPTHLPKQSFVYEKSPEDSRTKTVNQDFFNLQKTKPSSGSSLDNSFNQQRDSFSVFQQSVKSHTANHFDTTTRATTREPQVVKEFIPQTTPAAYNAFSATPNLVENYQFSTPSPTVDQNRYEEQFRSTSAPSFKPAPTQAQHFEYTPISQEIPVKKEKSVHKFNLVKSVSPEPTVYPTEPTRNTPQPPIPSREVHFYNHQTVQQYDQPGPHPSQAAPVNPSLGPEPSDVTFYNRDSQRPYETDGPHNERAQPVINDEPESNNAAVSPSNLEFYNNNNYHNQQQQPQQQFPNDISFAEITSSGVPTTTEYYRLPSELPPINANLPNMINGLMEKDEEENNNQVVLESEPVTLPPTTRRPVQRGRRPPQRITTSTENSDVAAEEYDATTTRRPIQRHRTRPPVQQQQPQPQQTQQRGHQQHYRTSTIVRNPNRVRFSPSPEERTELKRTRGKGGNRVEDGNDKNLDYQRDVLNQNYPVINSGTTSTAATTTAPPTTEAVQFQPESQGQDSPFSYAENPRQRESVVTVMAESYPNFDFSPQSTPSTYFPNTEQTQFNQGDNLAQKVEEEERLVYTSVRSSTENSNVPQEQPETSPVPQEERVVLIGDKPRRHRISTTTTETPVTTTEVPQSTIAILRNRRPAFVRRPLQRTTTESPAASEITESAAPSHDRFTIRSRTRGDGTTTPRNIPQIRGRVRQRTTTTPAPENTETENEETPVQKKPVYRSQYRSRTRPKFALETQETQWSTNLNVESFQPLDNSGEYITRKYDIIDDLIDNEPEIITADPIEEHTFIFTVTPKNQAPVESNDENNSSSKTEESDSESENDISPRIVLDKEEDSNDDKPESAAEATTESKNGKRRGVWRRIRVRPLDTFEAAESQHVSQPAYNILPAEYNNRDKYESKGSYNSFSKDFLSGSKADEDEAIETASALTMEKEPEVVTNYEAVFEPEITEIPETKIDPTEEEAKEALFESTTVTPKIQEIPTTQVPTTTQSPTVNKPSVGTTENIYDEVRKSLSDLFSRAPEEVAETTVLPDLEETNKDEQSSANLEVEAKVESTTVQNVAYTASPPQLKPDEEDRIVQEEEEPVTEMAHVVELPVEPEVKANVTEINRTYVIATSTSKQVSHETEICYRGRCIKTIEPKK